MKGRGLVWLGVLVVGGIASYFSVSGSKVAGWNDKVVASYNRFGLSWQRFQRSFAPYLKGQKVDEEGLESSFKQYERNLGQAAAALRQETPPDDDLCRQFHGDVVAYAGLQEEQLKEVRKILDQMKAANPGSPEDIDKVTEAFNALGRKESALQDAIQARQKKMADKFKLKIK